MTVTQPDRSVGGEPTSHNQRGWMGWLFLVGVGVAGYAFWPLVGIYANNYSMKTVMRQSLGDYIVFIVSDTEVEKNFIRRATEQKVDLSGVKPDFEIDAPERRGWAKGSVKYDRTYQLPFSKKSYTRHFEWTIHEKREE